jgi:ankyrin repeat protein
MVELTEDEIDDLMYFARANELSDLQQFKQELSAKHTSTFTALLAFAIDSETGNSPLHYASANGHLGRQNTCSRLPLNANMLAEIVKTLLDFQDTSDSNNSEERPPAPVAIVNAKNKSGNTPLHWAALNGHLDVILLLLKQGADPTILNAAGHDALFEAELNEKQEAVDLLLGEGIGLDQGLGGEGGEDGEDTEDVEDVAVNGSGSDAKGKEEDVARGDDQMDIDQPGEVAKG